MTNLNLNHVSEKSWGDIKESDYTVEQWHSACLIHQHTGPPTSKAQCKLPVKTPGGSVNRNGVHAAAAALAGARGGVNASSEEKARAKRAIKRLYSQLGEEAPDSMEQNSVKVGEEFIEHYGVKGMKWGVRRSRRQLAREARTRSGTSISDISDQDLKAAVNRMNLEQQYSRLSSGKGNRGLTAAGAAFVGGIATNVVRQQIQNQATQRVGQAISRRAAREAAVRRLRRLG